MDLTGSSILECHYPYIKANLPAFTSVGLFIVILTNRGAVR